MTVCACCFAQPTIIIVRGVHRLMPVYWCQRHGRHKALTADCSSQVRCTSAAQSSHQLVLSLAAVALRCSVAGGLEKPNDAPEVHSPTVFSETKK